MCSWVVCIGIVKDGLGNCKLFIGQGERTKPTQQGRGGQGVPNNAAGAPGVGQPPPAPAHLAARPVAARLPRVQVAAAPYNVRRAHPAAGGREGVGRG